MKIQKAIAPMLLLSTLGVLYQVMGTKEDIDNLKMMRSQAEVVKNSEKTMMNLINSMNEDNSNSEYKIVNIGIPTLDTSYKTIIKTTDTVLKGSDNNDKNYIIKSVHYLIFEDALTYEREKYCKSIGFDIRDYFSFVYDANKDIRYMIKAYLGAKDKIETLKTIYETVKNDEAVKNAVLSFNRDFFQKMLEETGKTPADICNYLAIGNMYYTENSMKTIEYKTSYNLNYHTLIRK